MLSSFDDRIDDLMEYKQMHGHLNVKFKDDESLYQFCAHVRHSLRLREIVTEFVITMVLILYSYIVL